MTETLADTRLQLQNAESSILFMQKEHAQTLQGLHAEISKLQKKCGGWFTSCVIFQPLSLTASYGIIFFILCISIFRNDVQVGDERYEFDYRRRLVF